MILSQKFGALFKARQLFLALRNQSHMAIENFEFSLGLGELSSQLGQSKSRRAANVSPST